MRAMFSDARVSGPWLALGALALLAGCASRPGPKPDEPAAYAAWTCDQLVDGIDAVQERAADVAYAIDARVGNNMIALGQGVAVFWPALLAMRPDGSEAAELSALKGRFEAMRFVADRRRCGLPDAAAQASAPVMPVELGDRLVYENRPGHRGAAHELGMRVSALRRDQLEFILDLDGRALPQRWQQDLAGNPTMAAARTRRGSCSTAARTVRSTGPRKLRLSAAHCGGRSPTFIGCAPSASSRVGTSTATPSGRLVMSPSLTTLAEITRGVPVSSEWIT